MRRHWSNYASVGAWFADYRGSVPIQIPAAISRLHAARGLSFADAYADLLARGAIIHVDDPAGGRREGRARLRDHRPIPGVESADTVEAPTDEKEPD